MYKSAWNKAYGDIMMLDPLFLTISIISFKIGIFNILKDKNYSE